MGGFFDHIPEGEGLGARSSEPAKPAREPGERFPCQKCSGTGKYQGVRRNQPESHCFACNGKGWFSTSPADRAKARTQRTARKAKAEEQAVEAFKAAHPGLYEFASGASWSQFLTEMADKVRKGHALSERQVEAIATSKAKSEQRDLDRAAAKAARVTECDLSAIEAMFEKAKASGLNKLMYRAEGLKLSPAKASSPNAGAIYVKTVGGTYLGKVKGGKFFAGFECKPEHRAVLEAIAANPAEVAAAYGKRTGSCACCGRELSDPASIAAGIGPICAEKWF